VHSLTDACTLLRLSASVTQHACCYTQQLSLYHRLTTLQAISDLLYCAWLASGCSRDESGVETGVPLPANSTARRSLRQAPMQDPRTNASGSVRLPEILTAAAFPPTQFPSAVLDWGDTEVSAASRRLHATLWANNSDLQASVVPTFQRLTAPINLASNAYLSVAAEDLVAGAAVPQLQLQGVAQSTACAVCGGG
jgi:hypothetical protein